MSLLPRVCLGSAVLGLALTLALAAPAMAAKKQGAHSKVEQIPRVERDRDLMGRTLHMTAEGNDSANVAHAIEDGFATATRIEYAVSPDLAEAEIARINQGPVQHRLDVSADLYGALDQALQFAQETDGAFDPTLGAFSRIWDTHGAGRTPSPSELQDARTRVGWPRVRIEPGGQTVWFQRDSMAIDLGGIERGYALDRVEERLRARGVRRALLDFGGDALAISDGPAWGVQIAHPTDESTPVINLPIRTAGVSTARGAPSDSSTSRVFDPISGVPLDTDASVTVVTRSAARAGALAIALLVMGRDRAAAFVESHPDVGALWLEPDGSRVRAWRWRLPSANPSSGAAVDWQN